MAAGPITSWQIDGETVETVTDFILLGSKITADGDCSHEIKRHLPFERKVMTNLDSVLKSRDITLPTNVHLVKAMVFPVVGFSIIQDDVFASRGLNSGGKGDMDSIPGSRRSPGGGNGTTHWYCCLKNSMDWRSWWSVVHGVAKSWTRT